MKTSPEMWKNIDVVEQFVGKAGTDSEVNQCDMRSNERPTKRHGDWTDRHRTPQT